MVWNDAFAVRYGWLSISQLYAIFTARISILLLIHNTNEESLFGENEIIVLKT